MSLPTYYFSLFKAPIGIIDDLEKLRICFIFDGDDIKSKMHWVSWSKIIASKKDGKLGVGSLKAQNISLLHGGGDLRWILGHFGGTILSADTTFT